MGVEMGKENAFVAAQRKYDQSKSPKCRFCVGILGLSAGRKREFVEAMHDRSITADVIADVLSKWGVNVSASAVTDHRAGRRPSCAERIAAGWR